MRIARTECYEMCDLPVKVEAEIGPGSQVSPDVLPGRGTTYVILPGDEYKQALKKIELPMFVNQ